MKLLIGYDGSDASQVGLQDLRWAGLPENGVEARVVSIADVWPDAAQPSATPSAGLPPGVLHAHQVAQKALADMRKCADEGAGRVRTLYPQWQVAVEARAGSPYWELVLEADRWKPDVVLAGTHGRTGAAAVLLGSVSQNVLNHAKASVRIGRKHVAPQPTGGVKIVLPLDGSADSLNAARVVAARKWPTGSAVMVLTVIDMRLVTALLGSGPDAAPAVAAVVEGAGESRETARKTGEQICKQLQAAGLQAQFELKDGEPKQLIVDEARRNGADCIFLGARGHTRLERLFLGSVSAAVAARAHCSVEVVR